MSDVWVVQLEDGRLVEIAGRVTVVQGRLLFRHAVDGPADPVATIAARRWVAAWRKDFPVDWIEPPPTEPKPFTLPFA